ncbi:MAG: glycosyltransferase [Tissierellia bacterium]|nr:glycosyltransferase [Tissierellia bacterium]
MNIAFLSSIDPFDIKNWSGTLYYITNSLMKQNSIEWIESNIVHSSSCFIKNKFYPESYAQMYGKIISERINRYDYDIIIVRDYFFGAYLKVKVPIIYIGDSTFQLFKKNIYLPSIKFEEIANDVEKRMIDNANGIIFSSKWAKESAICDYSCNKDKIYVVEFGANISHSEDWQRNIDINVCNLVFVGVNWQKKAATKF